MGDSESGRSRTTSTPSLSPPCPRSPPSYPDLYGKRRELAKLQMREREGSFLLEELKLVEGIPPASKCCKEVADFVSSKSDPLIPVNQKINRSCGLRRWLCGSHCFGFSKFCCCSPCSFNLKLFDCCCCHCRCRCHLCDYRCSLPKWRFSFPRIHCCCPEISCPKSCCRFKFPPCPSCDCYASRCSCSKSQEVCLCFGCRKHCCHSTCCICY